MTTYTERRRKPVQQFPPKPTLPRVNEPAPLVGLDKYVADNAGRDWSYAANNTNSGSLGELFFGQSEYKNTSEQGRLRQLAAGGDEYAKKQLLAAEYQQMLDFKEKQAVERTQRYADIASNRYEALNDGLTRDEFEKNTIGQRNAATGEFNSITARNNADLDALQHTQIKRQQFKDDNGQSWLIGGGREPQKIGGVAPKELTDYQIKTMDKAADDFRVFSDTGEALAAFDDNDILNVSGWDAKATITPARQASMGKLDQILNQQFVTGLQFLKGMGSVTEIEGAKAAKAMTALMNDNGKIKFNLSTKFIRYQLNILKASVARGKAIARISNTTGRKPTVMQIEQIYKDHPYPPQSSGIKVNND